MSISILITTYHSANFITATLRSIANQTYQNYEIVIVDDGSTDETAAVIKHFATEHPAITLRFYPGPHIGRAAALNRALQHAAFDFVAIIDADDLWHRQKLESQIKYINRYHLNFLATQSKIFYQQTAINPNLPIKQKMTCKELEKLSFNKMLLANTICHSSVIAKKTLLNYDVKRNKQIDYAMWLSLLAKGVPLYCLNVALTYHRIHKDQAFESNKTARYILSSTRLQLKHALQHFKLLTACLVIAKLCYYAFPKKTRLKIREWLFSFANKKSLNFPGD